MTFDAKREAKIIALYRDGFDPREIRERFGLPNSTLHAVLERHGLTKKQIKERKRA